MSVEKVDVAIIGGGALGLQTSYELSQQGYSVAVIERNPMLAQEASTRNQGILHNGAYHGAQVPSIDEASRVVENTKRSHSWIKEFVPESIENFPSYATVFKDNPKEVIDANQTDQAILERAIERWKNLGVDYKEIALPALKHKHPHIDTKGILAAFETTDESIDTRIYYQKLLQRSKETGVMFFTSSYVIPYEDDEIHVQVDGTQDVNLKAEAFVVSAGRGIPDFYRMLTKKNLQAEYWKSHVLVIPRVTDANILGLNPGGVMYANHGEVTVVTVNREPNTSDSHNYSIDDRAALKMLHAFQQLIPNTPEPVSVHTCIKTAINPPPEAPYSLDFQMIKVGRYLFVQPGKMSEVPTAAQSIIEEIHHHPNDSKNEGKKVIPGQNTNPQIALYL